MVLNLHFLRVRALATALWTVDRTRQAPRSLDRPHTGGYNNLSGTAWELKPFTPSTIGMQTRASEANIWSAQILMLLQAATESAEGFRRIHAFARRRDAE